VQDIKAKLREFLDKECGISEDQYDDDTFLFTGGLLDSMDILKLVAFLEETFDLKVNSFSVTLDSLDTLNIIDAFVKSQTSDQT